MIITNIHLVHWGYIDSDNCSFCGTQRETYLHLFIHCPFVQPLWIELENFMNNYTSDAIVFREDMVISNRLIIDRPGHVKNFMCLLTKQYIYRQRCLKEKLSMIELKNLILTVKSMEKYIAIKNGKTRKFCKKWGEPIPALED